MHFTASCGWPFYPLTLLTVAVSRQYTETREASSENRDPALPTCYKYSLYTSQPHLESHVICQRLSSKGESHRLHSAIQICLSVLMAS